MIDGDITSCADDGRACRGTASSAAMRWHFRANRFRSLNPTRKEVASKYRRWTVDYETNEPPGTVIVDTKRRFLFHVQEGGKATRYGVGVGKDGRSWYGEA